MRKVILAAILALIYAGAVYAQTISGSGTGGGTGAGYTAGTGITLTGTTFSLTSPVTSPLGGSGVASPTAHGILIGEGASAFASLVCAVDTVVSGATSADPICLAVNSCSGANNALTYNTSTHAFGCNSLVPAGADVNSSGQVTGLTNASGVSAGNAPQLEGFSALGQLEPETLSQDCAFTRAGANSYTIICTKTNNVAFAPSATTDTTNAGNISSGTLAVARGGSGAGTFTAHGTLVGEGTSAFHALAVCVTGAIFYGQTGADPLCSTLLYPNAATTGDLIDATGTNQLGSLADVAAGSVLASGGIGVAPSYSSSPTISGANITSVNGSNISSGTVAVARGGTGTGSPATVAGTGIAVAGSFPNQTVNSNAEWDFLGRISASGIIADSTPADCTKVLVASTIDNCTAMVQSQTCTTAQTFAVVDCGSSTTCSGATTKCSVQVTTTATATVASVSSAAIAAGDYLCAESTAGSCSALSTGSVHAQIHSN